MIEEAVLSSSIAWSLLILFSIVWISLGWWLGRHNRTIDDYMLAGRNVGMGFAVATAMATWVTSNTTMTAPQLAYQLGIWGMIGYSLGAVGLLLFAPLARRIKELMPSGFTSGDFMRLRYGKTTWRLFLIISLFYAFGWLISLGMAGGILIQSLSGIPYIYGMSIIIVTCTLYTVFGGLKAVIGTDFVQTVIIIVGVVLLAYLAIDKVGFDTMYQALEVERPELLNLLFPAAIMFLFNNLFFGVGEIFHSNVWWSRAFAFGKGIGFKAYIVAGIFWLPIPIVAGFIALMAPSLGINVPSADMVSPLVAGKLLNVTGAIIVFIVVFSALASSMDSLLAATSDLLARDIYRGHINPNASNERMLTMSRNIILGLGVATWILCLPRLATLGALLYFTGAFVASTIWPIVFGLVYRRFNGLEASMAMVIGTSAGLIGYFYIGFYVAALVSAMASFVTMAVITLMARRHDFDWSDLDENVDGRN